jgi:DNA-binding LacI/PurR family transcriptional regulator
MSLGLYNGLYETGLVPGRDIAIIGRDSPQAHYLVPRLTCFRLSLRDLGISLAEALLANMPDYSAHYPLGVVRKIVPLELVEGDSDMALASGA